MASTNSLENLIAQIIVGGGITWLKTKLWWDFDIDLSDEMVYKTYYEFKHWCIRNNVVDFVDRDLFIEVMVEVIKLVESETDKELVKDPEFVKKSLKEHAWLWNIYSFFRNYVTSENIRAVADSPVTKAIDRYLNSVMVKNPVLRDYKVHRDVDFALQDYKDLTGDTGEVKVTEHVFSEELEGETLLGGEMRLSAPYLTNNDNEL